jgi:hypothetical protein
VSLACYVLRVRSAPKLSAHPLFVTLLFGCAHSAGALQEGAARFPKNPAPGYPVAVVVAEPSPLRAALIDALVAGGAAAATADGHDDKVVAEELDALAARPNGLVSHRFVIAVGQTPALPAVLASRQQPLSGFVIVGPFVTRQTEPERAVPTLFITGDAAPPPSGESAGMVWLLRIGALDEGTKTLPAGQLHSFNEAIVLWIRARSAD